MAQTLSFSVRSEEAIALTERAITTYDEVLERRGKSGASTVQTLLSLILAYMAIGKEDKARNHAAEVLRTDPTFSLEWLRWSNFFKDRALLEQGLAALRKAGLKGDEVLRDRRARRRL